MSQQPTLDRMAGVLLLSSLIAGLVAGVCARIAMRIVALTAHATIIYKWHRHHLYRNSFRVPRRIRLHDSCYRSQ
jgi:hypothetical protein